MTGDGMYKAAFVALYERSRSMFPQIENTWGTPEIEDWCVLMRDLIRAEVEMDIAASRAAAWRVCETCGVRAFKDGLCAVHWASRYSCVPEWDEKKREWFCKNCGRGVDASSLKDTCTAKTLTSNGKRGE